MKIGGKEIVRTAATRITAAVAVVVLMTCATGCVVKEFEKVGALYSCDDFTVYPDSFVSQRITLTARGDSMMIRAGGDERYAGIVPDSTLTPTITGGDKLVSYLFNVGGGIPESHYDALTPYEIYVSEGLIYADSAAVIVDSRLAGDDVAEYARGAFRWPVAMADATWGLAAAAVSSMTADDERARVRMEALKRLVDNDLKYVLDKREGLFTGIPAEMDRKLMPEWANVADAAAMMTLEGNISRLYAMRCVNAIFPDSYDAKTVGGLSGRISRLFWIPNLGMLSQTLYQRPYPISVTAADNMVQAFAIVTGGIGDAMARKIVSQTPVSAGYVPVTYPDQGLGHDGRRSALTAAMWAIASAKVKNYDAWKLSYSSLVSMAAGNEYALRLLRGVTLRTVFGLEPGSEGLSVHPFVDNVLGESRRLEGFKYRNSELTVTIKGKGDVVSSFTLDGEAVSTGVIPPDLRGKHEIGIVLSGNSGIPGGVNVNAEKTMPAPPDVIIESPRRYDIKSGETTQFIVYLDGAISELIERNRYELYNAAPVTAVSFEADVSNVVTGYASKNYLYIPAADSVSIACKAVAHTGGRVLAKKDIAAKHVESTRYKNARLSFEFHTAAGGEYYVRLRYLDGLGVVNKNRQYALRLLRVNGVQNGVMVLPQRGPEEWSAAEDWASMSGTTLPVAVTLLSGSNNIEVEYFAPEGMPDFDHDSNTVIPLALEIIRKS